MTRQLLYIIILLMVLSSCVKPFVPDVDTTVTNYLVIEGQIISGGETSIKLSRTRSIQDSNSSSPDNSATVIIESQSGQANALQFVGNGVYQSAGLQILTSETYRVKVLSGNKTYLSDFVAVKQTPEIDSVEWHQENENNSAINISVNSHDPLNTTRFYRWDYIETYEYHAAYFSLLGFRDGEVVFLEPDELRNVCYTTNNSTEILLGNTTALQNDVIARAPIISIPNDNSKISVRYSILVRQYALNDAGYKYWQIVKQNSQPNGDIFDPQPSQLTGNIRCVENPDEPVIGFVNASTVTEKRIFIRWGDLKGRTEIDNSVLCRETFVERTEAAKFLNDGGKLPAYYITNGPLAITNAVCVDCTIRGGVTEKPSFW